MATALASAHREMVVTRRDGSVFTILYDDEDREVIESHVWHVHKDCYTYYAATNLRNPPGSATRQTYKKMHRLLRPDWATIDHVNGNGLDNRSSNLREATPRGQQGNKPKRHGKSRYKGVTRQDGRQKQWHASIGHDNRRVFLGRFLVEKDAALAYDRAAVEWFGEFALTNQMMFGEDF